MITIKPKFEIGEIVYYNLLEGEIGRVVDITYRCSTDIIWYHVVFDPQHGEIPRRGFEITREKQII